MSLIFKCLAAASIVVVALPALAQGQEEENLKSGYDYASDETKAVQDDEFANPALLWIEDGEVLWSAIIGNEGKSCESCHQDVETSMKGVGATYPKYDETLKKPITLTQKINMELTQKMAAEAWNPESRSMLVVDALIMQQSNGMAFSLKIDGPMVPFYEQGKSLYNSRNGQFGMACKHCHVDYPGIMLRGNRLSNGLANNFPTYRLQPQKLVSLHNRFKGCEKRLRAQPYATQSDEYVNMELYLKWRGRNIPVEMPSARP